MRSALPASVSLALLLAGLSTLMPSVAEAEWMVGHSREGVSRLVVDGARLPLGFDADRTRGDLRCAAQGEWLGCIWTHITMHHINEGWFVHMPSRRVRAMRFPRIAMTAEGAFGTVVGRPVWVEDGVRLWFTDRGGRHYWGFRRRPGPS